MLCHIAGLIHSDLTVGALLRGGAGLALQAVSAIIPAHYGGGVLSRSAITIVYLGVEGG